MAEKTMYFSAASASLKKRSIFILMTEGWRKSCSSDGGWMNWNKSSRTSDDSSKQTNSDSSFVEKSFPFVLDGTENPALVDSRCFLKILNRMLLHDLKVISALSSLTVERSLRAVSELGFGRWWELPQGRWQCNWPRCYVHREDFS